MEKTKMTEYVQIHVSRLQHERLAHYARMNGRSLRAVLDSAIGNFLTATGTPGYSLEQMSASAQAAKKERDRRSDARAAARATQEIDDNPSSPAELLKADDTERKILRALAGIPAPRRG
jgi:hypothetical protein